MDFDDVDLEKLSIYVKELYFLFCFDIEENDIDFSDLVMMYYCLYE